MFVKKEISEKELKLITIFINRAEKANAYTDQILDDLQYEVKEAVLNPEIKTIVITGSGNSFCAGADLSTLKTRKADEGLFLKSRMFFDYLSSVPKITIAAINGPAVGGGLELALACDFRLCSPNARFSLPELSHALTPAAGGMRRLPSIIGKTLTKEMIFLGKVLTGEEALKAQLVSFCGEAYYKEALDYGRKVSKLDLLSLTLAKKIIDFNPALLTSDMESVAQALLYERKNTKD